MIVVLANGMRNSFYNDSPNGVWPIESVIVKELIPHVDATYRTIAKREDRAVEGFSMGGYGAAHLGFKYPQVFGIVGIMSGALLRPQGVAAMKNGEPPIFEKMFGSDMARVVANDPFELVRQNATAIRGKTAIRIAVGSDDSLLPRNQAMHETLEELKIEHEFEVVPGVGHAALKFYETLGERAFRYYRKVLESQEKRAQ
jgi:endo-1,4-beta-xylanase